jgi:DNA-binding transcriptional MocR family regulator
MNTIAFARGVPAPDLIPATQLAEAAARVLADDPVTLLSYGTGGGYGPLRELLGAQHGVAPRQIVVTTGSLHGFLLLIEELATTSSGPPVAIVENPTYDRPLILFERAGWQVEHVRCDADGLDVDELDAALERSGASLLYTIPSYQNPGGSTLTANRRRALLQIAARHNCLVLEDDPYSDLWFESPPPPRLYDLPSDAKIVLARSFSKTVSPGLRVGYLVLPDDLAARIEKRANDSYISPSLLGNAIVHQYISDGYLEPGIAHARAELARRCGLMVDAIERHLPDAEFTAPEGGYFLWVRIPGENTAELAAAAKEAGVTFVAGREFGPGNDDALRLAFSSTSIDDLAPGIERIASVCTARA